MMVSTLSSEQLDLAALNLAKETRQLLGLPITPHLTNQDSLPTSSISPTSKSWPPLLESPPNALEFSRILARHSPVLINGSFSSEGKEKQDPLGGRPNLENWKNNEYLRKRLKDGTFKVTVTRDGKADDLKSIKVKESEGGNGAETKERLVFALPHEEELKMSEILTRISQPSHTSDPTLIYYLQSQDDNFKSNNAGDFSRLFEDLQFIDQDGGKRTDLKWATDAIGKEPEATNVWIGSERSCSSMHRDHYENLFTVIRGKKLFTVFPPTESHFLCDDDLYSIYQSQPSISSTTSDFTLTPLKPSSPIPWIPIDPTLSPQSKRNAPFPRYGKGLGPLKIVVEEHQTLFLPSGWFHHVSQSAEPLLQRKMKGQKGDQVDEGLEKTRGGKEEIEMEMEEIGICLSVNWWYESEGGFGDRWAWSGFGREVRRRLEGRWGEMEEEE